MASGAKDRHLVQARRLAIGLGLSLVAIEAVRAQEEPLDERLRGLVEGSPSGLGERRGHPPVPGHAGRHLPGGATHRIRVGLRLLPQPHQEQGGRPPAAQGRQPEGLPEAATHPVVLQYLDQVDVQRPPHLANAGAGLGTLVDRQDQEVGGLFGRRGRTERDPRHRGSLL
jgi:hypothetical protein